MLASKRSQVNCSFSKGKKYTKILYFLSHDKWETLREVKITWFKVYLFEIEHNQIMVSRIPPLPCPEEQTEVEGKKKEEGGKENYLFGLGVWFLPISVLRYEADPQMSTYGRHTKKLFVCVCLVICIGLK